jgi:hypothetical protein
VSDDLDPKRAAAAIAIEAWCTDDHDEPSTLAHVVVIVEMQTLSGRRWLHRLSATGTEGADELTTWLRRGMLAEALEPPVWETADQEDDA